MKKQPATDERQRLIRTEMAFLLEQNESWFEKQLQARLLDEGCNFPMILARPLFYEQMLSELQKIVPPELRPKFQTIINAPLNHGSMPSHPVFHKAIRFCASKCHDSTRLMALGATQAIQRIVAAWRLQNGLFQEDFSAFSERVRSLASPLWEQATHSGSREVPLERIRRRLYLNLITALLSKTNIRHEFEREFDSIPSLLNAIHTDHHKFCQFMSFCQERTPYFHSLASRTFWRTLETLSLEYTNEAVRQVTTV